MTDKEVAVLVEYAKRKPIEIRLVWDYGEWAAINDKQAISAAVKALYKELQRQTKTQNINNTK